MKSRTNSFAGALMAVACISFTTSYAAGNESNGIPTGEGARQIHLDFHTSEHMKDVGKEFSKAQFQAALKAGNVNSINVFSKGHHGWSYYDTKVGAMHPNLGFDLLKQQIEAAHEIGVRVQAYFAIGWSVRDTKRFPEALIRRKDGTIESTNSIKGRGPDDPMPIGHWKALSPEGAYLEEILAQTDELISRYALDGIWYDIVYLDAPNYSPSSVADMHANGVDPDDPKAARAYHVKKMRRFFEKTRSIIKKHKPSASIFYNWTTHVPFRTTFDYKLYNYNTKHDLEDLPTTWAGYDIFPWRAKYFSNTGKQLVAMSGKFHTEWGEFGGFKHRDALLYEAASMISFGAHANVGDQLHPSGVMDMATYRNIGHAFNYVEKIEDYGPGAQHVSETGIWIGFDGHEGPINQPTNASSDAGLVKMLLETQVNFVVVNNLEDWSNIETLIIPSGARLNEGDIARVSAFVEQGGNLVVFEKGLLDRARRKFQIDLGTTYVSGPGFDVDYTVAGDSIARDLPRSPFLNYFPAVRTMPHGETIVLASIREPFFSRKLKHYTSHRNTPQRAVDAKHPAVTKRGNVVFFAHALDRMYDRYGARVHKDLFFNVLSHVRRKPMIEVDMPSAGRVNLLWQPEHRRYVAHFLYGTPHQRGLAQVIEDLVPIYDVPVTVRLNEEIRKAYSIPDRRAIRLEKIDDGVRFTVPKVNPHVGVVFEMADDDD